MAEHVGREFLDVLGHDVAAALEEGVGLDGACEQDARRAARRRTR